MVTVLSGHERILADEIGRGWGVQTRGGAQAPRFTDEGPVFDGQKSGAFQVIPENRLLGWEIDLKPENPLDAFGYTSLRFAFHPGDLIEASLPAFGVKINDATVDLVRGLPEQRLDLANPAWQQIDIPISQFSFTLSFSRGREEEVDVVEYIRFAGNGTGTFYLDDIRLVTAQDVPPTAVWERHTGDTPEAFSLDQNFPNPFNSGTAIRFALPAVAAVKLTVYNLAGQAVATLAKDERAAGRYTLSWDGRDDQGHALASGLYVYRLEVADQTITRKMLLVR